MVTKVGGQLRGLIDGRVPGDSALTSEQAAASATVWLRQQGFADDCPLRLVDMTMEGDRLRVRFAPVRDDVVLMQEVLLLTVALDDGSPLSFEAAAYLQRHEREDESSAKNG